MAGLKKFVNNLIDKKVDPVKEELGAVAAVAAGASEGLAAKANMFIVDTASNMTATTKKIGDVELAPGDFVLDTATPKLWIVQANGTNKYITLS